MEQNTHLTFTGITEIFKSPLHSPGSILLLFRSEVLSLWDVTGNHQGIGAESGF